PSYFSARFKKQFGISPKQYFLLEKTELAKRYLLESELSVSEISERLGFANAFHFSRLFKKHSGTSPAAFRGERVRAL
ncbi:MAG: helix-turn-helix transcriptional regulator, partial [Spirochaetia bacterium]|nr:helix-turn-helix transcriptional regulator [Spirochaetia bacterium]